MSTASASQFLYWGEPTLIDTYTSSVVSVGAGEVRAPDSLSRCHLVALTVHWAFTSTQVLLTSEQAEALIAALTHAQSELPE
ncbi:hypothetical protein [Nocardia puris]|uniref:Uncharacterized protein n=1 Tax=Nocardia puris TaxID=208602 RepID=A0A366CYP6_9NOCA|nr:hypothetical protein [Nocardia puris]RBO82118.1 hypothetical protein DFR74_12573 [Nocardia puris]